MADLSQNLKQIQAHMVCAAQKAGRSAEDVMLIAVSKTKPVDAIELALAAGQRCFGENRVQEAARKFDLLRAEYADIDLHLIGPLQTNKVSQAVKIFDVIQTVDRPSLAKALAKEGQKRGALPTLYIQVNSGKEAQKHGVMPEDLSVFYESCTQHYGLEIDGLMCVPPVLEDPIPYFEALKRAADQLGVQHISMGMSGDYEKAIACGATEVRVGSALFGTREKVALR